MHRLRIGCFFNRLDLVAIFRGIFIRLLNDGTLKGILECLELGRSGLATEGDLGYLAFVQGAGVHVFQHRSKQRDKVLVAGRAAEATGATEIRRSQPAVGTGYFRFPTLWSQIGLCQQVREGEALGVGHAFCLCTRLTQIDLDNLIIDDLSQVNGRGVVAVTALKVFGHNL